VTVVLAIWCVCFLVLWQVSEWASRAHQRALKAALDYIASLEHSRDILIEGNRVRDEYVLLLEEQTGRGPWSDAT
jgi:hypothetical protein